MAQEYDAIALMNSWQFRDSLFAWDCDCMYVMNGKMIKEINDDLEG